METQQTINDLEKTLTTVNEIKRHLQATDKERQFVSVFLDTGDVAVAYKTIFVGKKMAKRSLKSLEQAGREVLKRARVQSFLKRSAPSAEKLFEKLNEGLDAPVREKSISWGEKHKFINTGLQVKKLIGSDSEEKGTTKIGIFIQQ